MQTNKSSFLKFTAISAILMMFIIPTQVLVFVLIPPPDSVLGFYELFQESALKGLLSLDLLYLLNNLFLIPIYIALYMTLKKNSPTWSLLALILAVIGIATYYPSNPAFEFLTLAKQYDLSTNPNDQVALLGAGEALLAGYTGTAFNAYYVLNALSLFVFSGLMFQSKLYTKTTSVFGLIAAIFMVIPSTAGLLGLIFSLLSLIPWTIFLILLVKTYLRPEDVLEI